MSSSSSSRRGHARPRRGYSARPSPPPYPDVGADPVSGDSHISAVQAANDSLRRGGSRAPPPPYRQGPHQPSHYGYGYGYGQPQQPGPSYGFVPYNYGYSQPPPGPQYGYGAPNPYIYGHPRSRAPGSAGFRPSTQQPTPRLADYRRRWRHAQQRVPYQAERFMVLSYNILADYLAQQHQFLYEKIPPFILDWNWRKDKLLFEFGLWSPDILCLQEVDRFTDLEREMTGRGYSGTWKRRTGNAADGCAIFWRTARFQLRYEEDIEFNKLGLRDNVAQLCVLEFTCSVDQSMVPRNAETDSTHLFTSPTHPQLAKQIVVCNIHVLYNPKRGEIKLGQVRTLLDRAYNVSKMWNNAPVILCGDFNSTPKSPLYNFILEQKLDLSGLAKSTISGQHTSVSPTGLYTGTNISGFRPPFDPSGSRVENKAIGNGSVCEPQTTIELVENSHPNGRGPANTKSVLTNSDDEVLLSKGPGKGCTSDAYSHANETENEGISSSPATVCGEIRQSGSREIISSSQLSSNEAFGPNDCLEELVGGTKVSNTQRDLPDDVISKDNHDEKEKAMLSNQDNCTINEQKSSHLVDSLNISDALHHMSNVSLEGERDFEATPLTSPPEPVHQLNGTFSNACRNQRTPEVIHEHSVSCKDESEDKVHSFEDTIADVEDKTLSFDDNTVTDEVLYTDMNSDPTFFEELSGSNDPLFDEEDQLLATSVGSQYHQQVGTSNEGYYYYDPYWWSPDERKAATGKDECTYVEHNLKLRSVYTDVEDVEGTKDANKEPLVTSYNTKFMGTVDYIWASDDLHTVRVLDTFPKEILKQTRGFPTRKWGSDHIALVCVLAFKHDAPLTGQEDTSTVASDQSHTSEERKSIDY